MGFHSESLAKCCTWSPSCSSPPPSPPQSRLDNALLTGPTAAPLTPPWPGLTWAPAAPTPAWSTLTTPGTTSALLLLLPLPQHPGKDGHSSKLAVPSLILTEALCGSQC